MTTASELRIILTDSLKPELAPMLSALRSACNAIKEAEEQRERWAKNIKQFYPKQDISEFYSPTKGKKAGDLIEKILAGGKVMTQTQLENELLKLKASKTQDERKRTSNVRRSITAKLKRRTLVRLSDGRLKLP